MSIPESGVKFNDLEYEIKKQCDALGCELLKSALEAYDAELARSRDRAVYRHKGSRKSVIKTLMGEVEYERAVYEFYDESGARGYIYLLDEAIGKSGSGFMSGLLSEKIVQASCESSYREAAREVSELTGQTVSHTAAWRVVQELGERIDAQEQGAAALASENCGRGKIESKVLFEEQDGIWLKLQGKSRKKYGASHEMKLAIAYDGTKKVGKKRYELTNKVACANFEYAGKFIKRKEGAIAGTYNADEIEIRLLNGDGAAWIKQSITDETVHFQLDPFHRNKAIRTWVKDPEKRQGIYDVLYSKDIDLLLVYIEALSNSVDDSEEGQEERENLLSLLTYFTNNKDGLVPCHRRGLDLPEPPEGKKYRRMGTMESNVFTILGNRMKGRRACWSVDGGNNLARLLCLKATKKLHETLQSLTTAYLPERYAEELFTGFTSSKVAKSVGKGYNSFQKAAAFPPTPDFKWMRSITGMQSFCEM